MKLFNTAVPVLSLLLLSALCGTVYGHEQATRYNQVSLEASASAEVENDTMIASLFSQEEGNNAAALSNKVNKKINWALDKLKPYTTIKVETESYSTYPVYNKSQIIAWRVKQSVRIESTDMSSMSEVLGVLQQQLKLNGISFDVSTVKRKSETQVLIDQALAAFNDRATRIANKLRFDHYRIVTMNVSTTENAGAYQHRMVSAMRAEDSSVVAPEIAKGDQTLTVRVSGTIELQ